MIGASSHLVSATIAPDRCEVAPTQCDDRTELVPDRTIYLSEI